jgi:hypothetical protein
MTSWRIILQRPRTPITVCPPDDDWDATCSIQIVRTLTARKFDDQPDGEKGILEAYLRAFNMAKDFIHISRKPVFHE